MSLPLSYSLRNLRARRLTTILTSGGMALVVFVFTATLMLAEGLRSTLVATGSPHNAIILRKGSETEVQSAIERSIASVAESSAEAAVDADGERLSAHETVVLMVLPKRGTGAASNVVIRGAGEKSLALRPVVRLTQGRLPRPGSTEIMVGSAVAKGFAGVEIGAELKFAQRQWRVVGVFDAGSTGFNSEIWGDGEVLQRSFRRNAHSLVLLRLADPELFETLRERLEADPRLQVEVQREDEYYEKQSRMLATFLRVLGISLTSIFSLGAVIGAVITMGAAVASRTAEIGTLRALGFQRADILRAFLFEALFLGLLGGLAGVGLASLLGLVSFSTTNFQTFAELDFGFRMTFGIAAMALGFSLFMGALGGVIPAVRASRLNIVTALRGE